jgi:hypothetical protein
MLTAPRTISPFVNVVVRSFADPADRASIEAAIAEVRKTTGRRYPLIIDGKPVDGRTFASVNPGNPDEVIGHVVEGAVEHA